MKPDFPFSRLPSLGELLKHPTVQRVIQRVNQTTIAQRATGFWDEFQANWKGHGPMPSMGELAERLAQRLLGRAEYSEPTVNATGVVCSRQWHAPLADSAVHELLRFATDYQRSSHAVMDRVAASIIKLTGAQAAWVASSYEAALSMTSHHEGAKVVSSPLIGLRDPAEFGRQHVDTIADSLNAGADLVVLDGAGLLGGPRCGIVVGTRKLVGAVRQRELATALSAEPMVLAALEATLELYQHPENIVHQIPVLQLLSTPLENLRQRCQRIAPLLAECAQVASAEAVECDSIWLDTGDSQLSGPSWAIALRPQEMSLERLAGQFEQATPHVAGRMEQDAYWLDFRAIFPRWDQQLVATLDGKSATEIDGGTVAAEPSRVC